MVVKDDTARSTRSPALRVYNQPFEAHQMSNTTPTVEGTTSALEGGVTNIPLDTALANIEGWQTTLAASDDPAAPSAR